MRMTRRDRVMVAGRRTRLATAVWHDVGIVDVAREERTAGLRSCWRAIPVPWRCRRLDVSSSSTTTTTYTPAARGVDVMIARRRTMTLIIGIIVVA